MRYFLGATAAVGLTAVLWAQEPPVAPELDEPVPAVAEPADVAPVAPPVAKPKPRPDPWNIITGSGNGWGNRIVIDNDGSGHGTTIISGARNGVGNRLVIINGQVMQDLPAVPRGRVAVVPARPVAPDPEVVRWLMIYNPEAAAAYQAALRQAEAPALPPE